MGNLPLQLHSPSVSFGMPQFAYHGIDNGGKNVRGETAAGDLAELKAWMKRHGLFLVSAHPIHVPDIPLAPTPKQASPSAERLLTDADKQSGWERWFDGWVAVLHTPRGMVGLLAGLALALFGDYAYFHWGSHRNAFARPPANPLVQTLQEIRPGTSTRGDIQTLFAGASPVATDAQQATYKVSDQYNLVIDFDATGGAGRPSNRVRQYVLQIIPRAS